MTPHLATVLLRSDEVSGTVATRPVATEPRWGPTPVPSDRRRRPAGTSQLIPLIRARRDAAALRSVLIERREVAHHQSRARVARGRQMARAVPPAEDQFADDKGACCAAWANASRPWPYPPWVRIGKNRRGRPRRLVIRTADSMRACAVARRCIRAVGSAMELRRSADRQSP